MQELLFASYCPKYSASPSSFPLARLSSVVCGLTANPIHRSYKFIMAYLLNHACLVYLQVERKIAFKDSTIGHLLANKGKESPLRMQGQLCHFFRKQLHQPGEISPTIFLSFFATATYLDHLQNFAPCLAISQLKAFNQEVYKFLFLFLCQI